MYEYIKGRLVEKSPSHAVIEVGGIAYFIHISLNTYENIKDSKETKLYIYFQVREDIQQLFGFSHLTERALFLHLISVPGIGPSTGRVMLSSSRPEELQGAILAGDNKTIQKLKGIGPKTAQRLIVELQDKLKKDDILAGDPLVARVSSTYDEAVAALMMLGFTKNQTEKALRAIVKEEDSLPVEELVKRALKKM
ncbi:MAG TPA: Holliday junction branch migration protein RuvA [Candidatus Sphingobacterium stercoripullorum]|uniref:Holliday junction branch migration complex subunit RuvA n=1 Tax=Candidatus Sphingobacterium stercoripullorum TaxID=2838759 RepID=A0A9D1W705_9SPHI|nr:Holliday junction branch migration protein RuvA [Candidatus Sphingobacterium stercoripullorum]HLR49299.1 Holliday junction branch migration protein RuvA [Candidatus Sphingobacterium stercoripullorum]